MLFTFDVGLVVLKEFPLPKSDKIAEIVKWQIDDVTALVASAERIAIQSLLEKLVLWIAKILI